YSRCGGLSPWRAFTRPPGAHIRWTRSRSSLSQQTAAAASSIGFTKQPCQLLAGCHFLDNQRSVKSLTHLSRFRSLKSGIATSIWRQEGYMAPKPKPARLVFAVGMALTILGVMTWAMAQPSLSPI